MSDFYYPTRKVLEWWIQELGSADPILKVALPLVDSEWFDRILDILERAKLPYEQCTLHRKAAIIFYNIAKAHEYVDGNKRSSIVILYLFYLTNSYYIPKSFKIKSWASELQKVEAEKIETLGLTS
ncbi:MAG: type II toxin-antitoxin system death-on-curing family toxin [Patescibacteria group bacterium]